MGGGGVGGSSSIFRERDTGTAAVMERNQPTNPTPFSYTHVCAEKWEIVISSFFPSPLCVFLVAFLSGVPSLQLNSCTTVRRYSKKRDMVATKKVHVWRWLFGRKLLPLFCRVRKRRKRGNSARQAHFPLLSAGLNGGSPLPPSFSLLAPSFTTPQCSHPSPSSA